MCAHTVLLLCLLLCGPERVCARRRCVVTGTGVFRCLSGEEGTWLNCFKSYQQCCWGHLKNALLSEGKASLGHTLL